MLLFPRGFDKLREAAHYWNVAVDLFPSGPWTGFYNYRPGGTRHYMHLNLKFELGIVTGIGIDDVGRFFIDGVYDVQTLECTWVKTYPGSHEVYYRGFREGRGIWGTWEIDTHNHGGFHIWPRGAGTDLPATEQVEPLPEWLSEATEPVPGLRQPPCARVPAK